MGEVLTDVDQFDATIEMPIATELADPADLRDKMAQRVANRTRYLYNRRNRLSATYLVTGSATFETTEFTLVQTRGDTGFSEAANLITLPSTGIYHIALTMGLTDTDTTNPTVSNVDVRSNSSISYAGDALVLECRDTRYSASTTHELNMSGVTTLAVTDVAAQKLWVTSGNQGTIKVVSGTNSNNLTIVKLSD